MHNMVIIIMMFNILESYQESKSLKFSSQRKKKVCEFIGVKQTYCNTFVVCTYTKSLWHSLSFCSFICNYTSIREKAMAPHSSTLAWKIPRMEESGRLQSMGSLRVRLD